MSDSCMVSVVLPAYNEQANIELVVQRLTEVLSRYPTYEILFVDDGSTDGTVAVLRALAKKTDTIRYLSLSRNFGHQQALRAGLDYARGDCVITMDCDLQHPPELIEMMIDRWREGYDIVYSIRRSAQGTTALFKRVTSTFFYRLMNMLSDIHLEQGVADFRLLDRRVVDVFRAMPEQPLFFRGMVSWVGYRQCAVTYTPQRREHGVSKYSFSKMLRLALEGITAFSVKPLRIAIYIGVSVSIAAFAYAVYALSLKLFTDKTIAGWTSVLVAQLFLGGIQLIVLGILGEYIGKLFIEHKKRPCYLVKEKSSSFPHR